MINFTICIFYQIQQKMTIQDKYISVPSFLQYKLYCNN